MNVIPVEQISLYKYRIQNDINPENARTIGILGFGDTYWERKNAMEICNGCKARLTQVNQCQSLVDGTINLTPLSRQ